MAEFDTAALMADILRDAKVPKGSGYRTASTLLAMVDHQLRTLVVPELLKVPGDLLAARQSITITSGRTTYRMPSRLLRIIQLSLVDPDGVVVQEFSRATSRQTQEFSSRLSASEGTPRWWYIEASSIVLFPTPTASGYTLTLRYARRPSRLVETTDCATVTSISVPSRSVVLSNVAGLGISVPSGGTVVVDVVKSTPGFECIQEGYSLTFTPGGSISSVAGDAFITAGLEVGDYVCLNGEAPVPQIPADYHPVLAQAVVAQIAKEQGDSDGEAAARQRMVDLLTTAQPIIEPRAEEDETCVQHDWL